jgi:diacylglycerol kinase (ATP)
MTDARATEASGGADSIRRIAVAINPQASFGRRSTVGPAVVRELRASGYEVVELVQPNFELLRRETTKVIDAGAVDALVVVGGDGMVSLGINLLAQTELPLGIVASGTGNDMARTLGLPLDDADASIAALLAALRKAPRRIDLGRVRHGELSTWFGGVVSAGFDARVNERANGMTWPRGSQRYTLAMVRELLSFKPVRYRLEVDGIGETTEAMLVSVANGRSIGGGMRVTPNAELDDGLLDLFVVERMSKLRLLRVFPKVFRGQHTDLPEVRISRVRQVSIAAETIVVYADGERVGPLPVEVAVVPAALFVLA